MLAKLYTVDGPFVTIYLATPSDTEDAAAQLEVRWKNVTRELAEADVDGATIEALARGNGRGGETWQKYYGRFFRDALDVLAVEYGLAARPK